MSQSHSQNTELRNLINASFPQNEREYKKMLQKLRLCVMLNGIDSDDMLSPMTNRGVTWKILMGVNKVDFDLYSKCCTIKQNDMWWQIYNDHDRTFRGDRLYEHRQGPSKIIRVVNALCNLLDEHGIRYIQGMNVLAGMFICVMPELDSFCCLGRLILNIIPSYYGKDGNISGTHEGAKLMVQCLEIIDPTLYEHLRKNEFHHEFILRCFVSLSTCTKPLKEALILWDYYFACGVHNVVYVTLAQLLFCRRTLIKSESPANLLMDFPDLEARKLIKLANIISLQIPHDLKTKIERHTTISSNTIK
ncbi:Cell division control protein [Entamoeba marina]